MPEASKSCSNILQHLSITIWTSMISVTIIILNSIVIIKHVLQKGFHVNHCLLQFLAIADLSFGIYLAVIVISDIIYGEQLGMFDSHWKGSIACHTAGILSSLSFIMDAITVTWLAVTRWTVITKMGARPKWFEKKTLLCLYCTIIILLLVIFATLMAIEEMLYGHVLQSNTLCLILITKSQDSFLMAIFSKFIIYLLIPLCGILCFSYINIFQHTKEVSSNINKLGNSVRHKGRDQSLSLNLALISMSHTLCWLTTFILSHLLTMQVKMPVNTMVILVVGIMPLNTILNPILYTLKSAVSSHSHISVKGAVHTLKSIK